MSNAKPSTHGTLVVTDWLHSLNQSAITILLEVFLP